MNTRVTQQTVDPTRKDMTMKTRRTTADQPVTPPNDGAPPVTVVLHVQPDTVRCFTVPGSPGSAADPRSERHYDIPKCRSTADQQQDAIWARLAPLVSHFVRQAGATVAVLIRMDRPATEAMRWAYGGVLCGVTQSVAEQQQ